MTREEKIIEIDGCREGIVDLMEASIWADSLEERNSLVLMASQLAAIGQFFLMDIRS